MHNKLPPQVPAAHTHPRGILPSSRFWAPSTAVKYLKAVYLEPNVDLKIMKSRNNLDTRSGGLGLAVEASFAKLCTKPGIFVSFERAGALNECCELFALILFNLL